MKQSLKIDLPMTMDGITDADPNNPPKVCFFGWCQQGIQITKGQQIFWHLNLIGLTRTIVSYLYPFNLKGQKLLLSIYGLSLDEDMRITFRAPDKSEVFWLGFTSQGGTSHEIREGKPVEQDVPHKTVIPGWTYLIHEIDTDLFVLEPSILHAYYTTDAGEQYLGTFSFEHAALAPYTEEELAAFRSNPNSLNHLRFKVQCKECKDELKTYAGLERNKKLEEKGWIYHSLLPDKFVCTCGKTKINLNPARTGLHAFLGRSRSIGSQPTLNPVRLYEKSALEEKNQKFSELFKTKCSEEKIHQFLNSNPVLLSPFQARRLMTKKPVLTKHVTDFAILNHKKELILIEIEKPSIRLLRKDGEITAALNHAISQVRDWLQAFEDHRTAALACLDLKLEDVTRIKGVVIAGRTPKGSKAGRHLRSAIPKDIEFFTYDDLHQNINEVIEHLEKI